jgi:hypothetical protein
MIGLAPKTQDVYDNWKKNVLTNNWTTKIWSFPLHYGSIDVIKREIQIMWIEKKTLEK